MLNNELDRPPMNVTVSSSYRKPANPRNSPVGDLCLHTNEDFSIIMKILPFKNDDFCDRWEI